MKVTRRNFLKWAGISALGAVACNVFPDREMQIQSPVEIPEDLVRGRDTWYATLCGECPEREGILVRVMEGRAKKVRGNPLYRTNAGKQSVRCDGALQTLYHPDRLSGPMRRTGTRREGAYAPISWDEAMNTIASRLGGIRASGNSSLTMMVTGPMRGHQAVVVDRFASAYGGRYLGLDLMGDSVLRATASNMFGQMNLPSFDLENSTYLLSFGADFLSTWLSPVQLSRGFGNLRSHEHGGVRGSFVHIGARYSATAASADEWIPVRTGMEGVVALSMAHAIIAGPDSEAAANMAGGASRDDLLAALDPFSAEHIADPSNPWYVGVPESIRGETAAHMIERIASEFAHSASPLAIGGGEAAAHTNGPSSMAAVYLLNYLAGSVGGRIGDGGVVFNPAPPLEELELSYPMGSMDDWTEAASNLRGGQLQALMVCGANPAYSLPNSTGFANALDSASDNTLVVSFSSFMDDTAQRADLVLPVRSALEDWGDDVPDPGPGFQTVGFQQPVVNPLPDLDPRSFPDLLLALSGDLGLDDGLPDTFYGVLRDAAQRLFDTGRGTPLLKEGEDEPRALTFPAFWNMLLERGGWEDREATAEADAPAPPDLRQIAERHSRPRYHGPAGGNTFLLVPFLHNSILDGRGAHLPWLQAAPDPLTTVTWQTWVEINAHRARQMGLQEGDVVSIVSTEGDIEAVVYPHPALAPDVVGVPVGQGHLPGVEYATRDGEVRGGNILSLLSPQTTDPDTGASAWASTQVRVTPTGRNVRVSKFEGIVTAFPIGTEHEDPVQVTGS